jgi:threonylcarbamoyladenosine tRNA methylthiotransferase MtaB
MPKYKTITLGCKVNLSESDIISNRLEARGWRAAAPDETANLCIINTCAVTQKASQQSRQAVRQAIGLNPNARILVTGCYAQVEPDEIRNIAGVHEIVAHEDKLCVPDRFHRLKPFEINENQQPKDVFETFSLVAPKNRTRPFLKIQDGCDALCTYCIVPYARGRSRSMHPDRVLENIHRLKHAGFREVVLSGIHLGCYGRDLESKKTRLADLLSRIDNEGTIDRVRLSSIEPLELTKDIIDLVATSNRLCDHFHIPLQSGDNRILKRMGRPYSRDQFKKIVFKIHESMPNAAIGVDVMIGFPGETDRAFKNTYRLIQELPVSYLHVFPFSPRKGTPAHQYPDQITTDVKKMRCQQIRHLGLKKKKSFYQKFFSKKVKVLIENVWDFETGNLKGKTTNYIDVTVEGSDALQNQIVTVKLVDFNENHSVWGRISSSPLPAAESTRV